MALTILKQPLLPVITLEKNDTTLLTFNPFIPTFDFRLRSLDMEPSYQNVKGKFELKLTSAGGDNAGANTIISNVDAANEVVLWVGKTDGTKKKLFRGLIEDWEITEPNKNFMDLKITGPDWGGDLLKNRIVNAQFIQDKLANGVDLDPTDNDVLIKQIVTDLLTIAQSYPAVDVTVEDQGVIVSAGNINPPDIRLAQFNANMEFLDDKLTELDDMAGTIHWIDADKNFHMEVPTVASAALPADVLLTDDFNDTVAQTWDQTKLGLIIPPSTYKQTLEHHKRRLFGLGGDQITIDQKQETDAAQTNLDVNYLAQRFSPRFRIMDTIGVFIEKVGSPTLGPVVEIIEDDGTNQPLGTILRTLSKAPAAITSSPGWHFFKIREELNTALNYWVVMPKVGDASNTYAWHKDAATNNVNGFSPDGASWTIQSSSFGFMFRQYTSSPILAVFTDSSNLTTAKHPNEDVIRKPDITETPVMWQLIRQVCEQVCKRKDIYTTSIYAPDTVLESGQKVRVRKQQSGFIVDDEFVLGRVDYHFASSDDLATGSFWYGVEGIKYVTI